jgi:hypothetical protein
MLGKSRKITKWDETGLIEGDQRTINPYDLIKVMPGNPAENMNLESSWFFP